MSEAFGDSFDLIVVGTGSAGTTAALRCARAGWRVAIVDERPFGGTCALRGCAPKKVLVGAAAVQDWTERMRGSGIEAPSRIAWADLMRFKRTFTDPVPAQRQAELAESGITAYQGAARFAAPDTMTIAGHVAKARYFLLAIGARPATLNLVGEDLLITSADFLDLVALPKRICFIGGGYIAFEFAHVASRAGASPVILQRGSRVLTGFEPRLVDRIVAVSQAIGIEVRVNAEVEAVAKTSSGFQVTGRAGGAAFALECDLVVHAAGRVADLDGLGLEAGVVERTPRGVAVTEFMQSRSNPSVFAAGDCADGGGLPLSPTAALEGDIAARNMLEGNRYSPDFSALTTLVFTIPPLGSTGLTTEQAQARGLKFSTREGDSSQWYSSRQNRARCSAYCVLIEEETGLILGAHLLGPHAEEVVNVFALAIRARVPAEELKDVLFGYPTGSSDIEYFLS
ncbi:MAG TPA: NAD(P)/FAD-dependent oxidoreductase [Candidatus Cybelea sp.]|jgi:glutathione reductase (NADPH)